MQQFLPPSGALAVARMAAAALSILSPSGATRQLPLPPGTAATQVAYDDSGALAVALVNYAADAENELLVRAPGASSATVRLATDFVTATTHGFLLGRAETRSLRRLAVARVGTTTTTQMTPVPISVRGGKDRPVVGGDAVSAGGSVVYETASGLAVSSPTGATRFYSLAADDCAIHIMDPEFGHVTIKMSGHPPFGAQVILNGHELVAAQAKAAGVGYTKEGNCFTATADPAGLARIADTLSEASIVGRLGQVCDRWIYTACACFGLDLADQQRSGFAYSYSIYQVEYSRNLIFASGARLDRTFEAIVDRTRSRLDVPKVRTMFGTKGRPHRKGGELSPRQGVVIEKPAWDLTIFKVHFGLLTLKAYSKGEHVLRFEAVVHNTRQLGVGRVLERFPLIVDRLRSMVERFLTMLDCVDVGFIADGILDDLPTPSRLGAVRVGGIDTNKPRARAVMAAAVALSVAPDGFAVADFAAKVNTMGALGATTYTVRQAAYDLRKLRGKDPDLRK